MTSPFDQIAASYSTLWSETEEGRSQREEVWLEIDNLFHAGDTVLDLGCGIGDDALHLMPRGVNVVGIDISQEMVAIAQSRGVDAQVGHAFDLPRFDTGRSGTRPTGALSNFGALNCTPKLEPVAEHLAQLLPPNGYFALCVMGRFHWRETLRFLFQLDLPKATRRWSGRAIWRDVEVRYWSAREIRKAFELHFTLKNRVPIGKGDHQLYILSRNPAC